MRIKKTLLTVSVIAFVSLLSFLLWYRTRQSVFVSFYDDKTGIHLRWSDRVRSINLTENELSDGFILRLQKGPSEKRDLLIRLSYEQGLRSVTTLTRSDLIPLLMSNAERSLPQKFPDLAIESKRQFDLNGHKAGEVVFTYTGPAGAKIKRRLIIIDKDGNMAIYLAAEATDKDFADINKAYFDPTINSLRFNE